MITRWHRGGDVGLPLRPSQAPVRGLRRGVQAARRRPREPLFYTGAVPIKVTLPSDLEARLAGLGDAIGAACPDVLFMYLFGSAATGTRTPRSDVDLAIFVAPGADAHSVQLAMAREAARQLGTDAVDVVLLNGPGLDRGPGARYTTRPAGSGSVRTPPLRIVDGTAVPGLSRARASRPGRACGAWLIAS